jgi:hypothetical protein
VLAARNELMVRRSPGSLPQLVTTTVTRRPAGARSQCSSKVAGGFFRVGRLRHKGRQQALGERMSPMLIPCNGRVFISHC